MNRLAPALLTVSLSACSTARSELAPGTAPRTAEATLATATSKKASLPARPQLTPAQEARVKPQDAGWEFLLSPYLWAVGLDGDLKISGNEVPIDVGFSDVFDDFNGGGSLFFEARKGPLAFGADGTFVSLRGSEDLGGGASVKTDTDVRLLGLDGSYRLFPASAWDLILGVRAFDLDNSIEATGMPAMSGGISTTHGVVGVRGRWKLDSWRFNLRGDVGGATGESSWQLLGLVGYRFGKVWGLDIGYRGMGLDLSDGPASLDVVIHGLMLGAAFSW